MHVGKQRRAMLGHNAQTPEQSESSQFQSAGAACHPHQTCAATMTPSLIS